MLEVDCINKQKFLTELGRLLTFMYEEDRQKALSMYTRMFEETEDEQGLLQLLVSPTRQAVVLARTYDAKERKLQVHAQAREEYAAPELDERPPFVLAIEKIAEQAEALAKPRNYVSKEQISLFEDLPEEEAETAAGESAEAVTEAEAGEAGDEPAAAAAGEAVTEKEEAQEPEAPAAESEPEKPETEALFPELPEIEDIGEKVELAAAPVILAAAAAAAEEPAAEVKVPDDLKEAVSNVDSFLKDFSIEDKLEPAAEPERVTEAEVPAPAEEFALKTEPARKVSVVKLILFLILGIPLTLLGIVVLLIPALLFLALSATAIYCGLMTFSAAFGGFSVFADKLVLIGAGIALLALGLLFVWAFIWFLGGAIAGLIRGVFTLGRKWCCKEVAKQ